MKKPKEISWSDYLKVVGLFHLAHECYQKTEDIVKAVAELVDEKGDEGYYGHVSDCIYEDINDADELLRRLAIKIGTDK